MVPTGFSRAAILLVILGSLGGCGLRHLKPVDPCEEELGGTAEFIQRSEADFAFLLPSRFIAGSTKGVHGNSLNFTSAEDRFAYSRGGYPYRPLHLTAANVRTCEHNADDKIMFISTGVAGSKYQVIATILDFFEPGVHLYFAGSATSRNAQLEMIASIRSARRL
jgi:hypothetical protein